MKIDIEKMPVHSLITLIAPSLFTKIVRPSTLVFHRRKMCRVLATKVATKILKSNSLLNNPKYTKFRPKHKAIKVKNNFKDSFTL